MEQERKKEGTITLRESNRPVLESLKDISNSIFKGVYQQADRTLFRVIEDNEKYKEEEGMDRQGLNVVSFLGGRGRGKTSALLSFLSCLNELQKEIEWSKFNKNENKKIQFVTLPYIDAAMLAEAEYVIDVILAEMWDQFEGHTKRSVNSHNAEFERLERDIKQQFINVRQAYLLLKEREDGKTGFHEKEVPVPSALHDLAASINLRDELQKLINDYLKIFQYGSFDGKGECYLVIAIDDVDMSGQKAHFILEQIRRFLRVQKVVIFITADIDRLQQGCEARYQQIYTEKDDRRKFINEYLEKVLPYNMRIYMPEIREKHGEIPLDTEAKKMLNLTSDNEKDMILEFMAKKCGIYFDGNRRKRHFLQNQSMRSMVNYFEQIVRMEEECLAWLKIDLKERIIERIQDIKQKRFMLELLSKDYEEINNYLITYLEIDDYGFSQKRGIGKEKSMGRALCACHSYEGSDARNAEFVDAVIMLYSIILKQADEDTRERVIGKSLLGEWEYSLISSNEESTSFCQSFDLLGSLDLETDTISAEELKGIDVQELVIKIIRDNKAEIVSWLCSLFYVTLDVEEEIEFVLQEMYWEPDSEDEGDDFTWDLLNMQIKEDIDEENLPTEDMPVDHSPADASSGADEYKMRLTIKLKPMTNARKNYLTNAFKEEGEIKSQCDALFLGVLSALTRWLEEKRGEERHQVIEENLCKALLDEILAEAGIIPERNASSGADAVLDENAERRSDTIEADGQDHTLISVELLYSIGKVLSNQVRTYEFDEKEAYRMLQSSYQLVKKELHKRDAYFNKLQIKTNFEDKFEHSLPAKVLLLPDFLGQVERKKFEMRLGELLMEYRGKTTVLQKSMTRAALS